jgi:site-specific DNA recombinase
LVWTLLDERGEYRLRLESASEPFETSSAMGRAMIGMLAIFAQLEADMCSERTSAALDARRARGLRLGPAPLVEVNPELVARVRALYASGGFTHASLAARLNDDGVASPRGGKWHATTVARALRSAA